MTNTGTSAECVLVWFRGDLRLGDQPALRATAATGGPVVPLFVWAPEEDGSEALGAASRWWLHQSLVALEQSLQSQGLRLIIRRGPTAQTLLQLADETKARRIFCDRVYEPARLAAEPALEARLRDKGVSLESFNGSLLFEPGSIRTVTGGPFRVFTPFWRALWNERGALRKPLTKPKGIPAPLHWPTSLEIADLGLEPKIDWAAGIRTAWTPGENTAQERLRRFAQGPVSDYGDDRDRTDRDGTSRLSPHLHFGEISPIEIWHAVAGRPGAEPYLRQLAWREFAYQLLVENPETTREPFQNEFRRFPWRRNARHLRAWQKGLTGYPFVDAAMRQLWRTGWMHNRARLVVASFLAKHLLIPWQQGAAWFLETLVDADLANNTMGWQWVAGCGVDAAPYFRVFNPITQGEKFDPDGSYVRQWVPELAGLPNEWIHRPWEAPPLMLAAAGVQLGTTYPRPLVDHAEARRAALQAFQEMKQAGRGK
ncbi:MAG TPA: deoxyribodipyrimidine photo-lyase [Acidobacteriaceae bacterium]|jgi:deoxyribodipyrimidine photo-lyase|nr:deoxyribodipyrimidine photo-lyase [Acidobacteriaceae bacterium]